MIGNPVLCLRKLDGSRTIPFREFSADPVLPMPVQPEGWSHPGQRAAPRGSVHVIQHGVPHLKTSSNLERVPAPRETGTNNRQNPGTLWKPQWGALLHSADQPIQTV